jgi:hypothetical protein
MIDDRSVGRPILTHRPAETVPIWPAPTDTDNAVRQWQCRWKKG